MNSQNYNFQRELDELQSIIEELTELHFIMRLRHALENAERDHSDPKLYIDLLDRQLDEERVIIELITKNNDILSRIVRIMREESKKKESEISKKMDDTHEWFVRNLFKSPRDQ
jgi:hypothetical protein